MSGKNSSIAKVSDATFEREVLLNELPVLVDFVADWCEPCKKLSPIVAGVAEQLQGKLKVVQVDIDRNPMLAQTFRIQSIPLLALVHQGRIVGQLPGLVDAKAIMALVKPVLPTDASEIMPADLWKLLQAGRARPVDVRERIAFERYRVPGAIHLPASEVLDKALQLRPSDGRLRVLYGRSTEEAKTLAETLRQRGVEVGFLAGGFLHWEADGLTVEKGAPAA